MVYQDFIEVNAKGRGFYEITSDVANIVSKAIIRTGICQIYIQHTSASLIICENADPNVLTDLGNYMQKLVKDGDPGFLHTEEGEDDMSAHIRSVLTQTSISMPISQGQLVRGTWQGLYVWEHRYAAMPRRVTVTLVGEELV